jgi:esterase/lipase
MKKQNSQEPITRSILIEVLKEVFKENDQRMDKRFTGIDKKLVGLDHQSKEVKIEMRQSFSDIGQKLEDINDSTDATRLIVINTKDNLERYQKAHAKEHDNIEVGFARLGLKYENIK